MRDCKEETDRGRAKDRQRDNGGGQRMGIKMVRVRDGRRKNIGRVKRTRERARARVGEGGKDREREEASERK